MPQNLLDMGGVLVVVHPSLWLLFLNTYVAGGKAAQDKRIVMPRHTITLAVKNDEELNRLLENANIASEGVSSNIQAIFVPKKSFYSTTIMTCPKKLQNGYNLRLLTENSFLLP